MPPKHARVWGPDPCGRTSGNEGNEGDEGDEGHEGYESHEGLWCGSMQCFVMWGRRMLVGHEIHEEVDEEG